MEKTWGRLVLCLGFDSFLVEVYLKLKKDQVCQSLLVLKPDIPAFVSSLVFIIPIDN